MSRRSRSPHRRTTLLGTIAAICLACAGCQTPAHANKPPPGGSPSASPSTASPPPSTSSGFTAPSASPPPPRPRPSAAPTASAESAPSPRPHRSYSVAAIGDSLTSERSGGGGYLKHLRKLCPESRFDDLGVGGQMVNQMRRRFGHDVFGTGGGGPAPRYDHVIVFGGVNDLYSDLTAGRTVKKITTDLAAMYAEAKARGTRVVALTVAPWGGFRRYFSEARHATTLELNRWILGQIETGTVDHAIDTFPLLSCGNRLCDEVATPYKDGLHFGPEGHRRIAQALHRDAFDDCR